MPRSRADWQADIDHLRVGAVNAITAYGQALRALTAATERVVKAAQDHAQERRTLEITKGSLPFLRRGVARAEEGCHEAVERHGSTSRLAIEASAEVTDSREHVVSEERQLGQCRERVETARQKLSTAQRSRDAAEAEAIAVKRRVLRATQAIDTWLGTIASGIGRSSPPQFIQDYGTPASRFKGAGDLAREIGDRHRHFFQAARQYLEATKNEVGKRVCDLEREAAECRLDWRDAQIPQGQELLKRLSIKLPEPAVIHRPFGTLLNTMRKAGHRPGRLCFEPLDGSAPKMPPAASSPRPVPERG